MVVAQPGYVRGDKFQSWVAMVCSHNRKAAVGEVGVMEEEERTVATDTSNAMVGMVESRCDAAHLCTSLTHPDQAGQVLSTQPATQLTQLSKLSLTTVTNTEPQHLPRHHHHQPLTHNLDCGFLHLLL